MTTKLQTRIRPISYEEVERYTPEAEKEELVFAKNTEYYGVYDPATNILMGFFGVLIYESKVIYKNDYVLPKYRGRGIHRKMMKYRQMIYRRNRVHEATCTDMSYKSYLMNGFKPIKKYKNGLIKVIKEG